MNTIDHRILIPATPNIIWNFVSNLTNNPIWQVDCKNIAFLTTTHAGQGTRLRYTNENGREQVIEITAWYNQLGYEYVIIDGTSFAQNKGRIRLQEIAEGTIVEWTFNYELGGLFSGLRNTLSTKRNVENAIVDSLWTLWRHIGQMQNDPDYHAKSLMRDAPDVEQRASYQPRHPSIVESTGQRINKLDTSQGLHITEPPIEQDDTRPRPAISPDETEVKAISPNEIQENVAEPDFLSDFSTSDIAEVKRQEDNAATNIDKVIAPDVIQRDDFAFKPPEKIQELQITPDDTSPSETIAPVQSDTESEIPEPSKEYMLTRFEDNDTVEDRAETETLPKPDIIDEPPPSETDTSKVSVFDLFGVTKPSETQEIQEVKITPEDVSSTTEPEPIIVAEPPITQADTQPKIHTTIEEVSEDKTVSRTTVIVTTKRTGQRFILRQKLISLRRPE